MRARPTWKRAAVVALAMALEGLLAAASTGIATASAESGERRIAASIQGRRVAGHVQFLASDFLEGRAAGTRGERLAAEYLRAFYSGLGLAPAGPEGSFFQSFHLDQVSLGENNAFAVVRTSPGGSELRTDYALDSGFVPFNFSPSARVEAPVVFAGYGISAPELGYDDYAGLDVRGRVVLVLRHEPREADPESVFNGLRATRHAAFLTKVRLAQSRGALALLLVTDPVNHTRDDQDPGNRLARWSSLSSRDEFDQRPPPDPPQLYPKMAPDVRIPALHISTSAAADLLSGTGRSLQAIQEAMDDKLKPDSRVLDGIQVALTTDIRRERVPVRNVLARLEGSDPAVRDEVVVLGGHYDHVGYGHFGSITGSWGQIHPGADDNASGTAAILSVAEALARAPQRPRRSVLFIHFTAEEKGLMGSRWFVEHPTVPMDKVLAMINLDMVGRNDPGQLSVNGDEAAAGLDALVQRVAEQELGITINHDAGSGIDRSDQWAFALQGVPAVAFFSGEHDDYHRPSDIPSRIVPDKLERVARLAALTVWRIAQDGRELISVTSRAAAVTAVALLPVALQPAGAEDTGAPRELVRQAVAAHGGEAGLRQWSSLTCEGKATYFFGGNENPGRFRLHVRDGRMVRQDTLMTIGGAPAEFVTATTGTSAWQRRRGRIYDVPAAELQSWLAHRPDLLLRAAAAPASSLAAGGPGELEGVAMDVVVFTEDGRETRILLDPGTHLVRGLEYRALNFQMVGNPEEIPYKMVYGDYHPVNGVPFPHRMEEFREGVRRARLEAESVQLGTPPQVTLFARPAPDEQAREWPDQIAN